MTVMTKPTEVSLKARRRQYTAAEKLRILREADAWVGVRGADRLEQLLRGADDRDGQGQEGAKAVGRGRALGYAAGDVLRLGREHEAHHPLGFLKQWEVPRGGST